MRKGGGIRYDGIVKSALEQGFEVALGQKTQVRRGEEQARRKYALKGRSTKVREKLAARKGYFLFHIE